MAAKVDYAKAMANAAQSIMMSEVNHRLNRMDPAERNAVVKKLNEAPEEALVGVDPGFPLIENLVKK